MLFLLPSFPHRLVVQIEFNNEVLWSTGEFSRWRRRAYGENHRRLFLVLFFVVIATVGYLKYRKGSLELELTTTSYREGDTLRGVLNVKARKPLHADKITASIWCEERWEEFDGMRGVNSDLYHNRPNDDRHGTEKNSILYRTPDLEVSGPVDIKKGETLCLEVTVQIPKEIKLSEPSYTRQKRSSYGSSSYYDTRPFTGRNGFWGLNCTPRA